MLGQHLVEGFLLGGSATVGEPAAMGVSGRHAVAARKMETNGELLEYHVVLAREPWVLGYAHVCTRRHNTA